MRPGLLHTRPRVPLVPRGATEHAAGRLPRGLPAVVVVVVVDVVEVDAEPARRRRTVVRLVPVPGSGPSPRVSREHQHFTEASQLLHEDRDLSAVMNFYSFTIRVLLSLSRSAVFTCTSELEHL